jgi:hypothetical protein
MKTKTVIIAISILLFAATVTKAGPETVAELSPELRNALVRDAACSKDSAREPAAPKDLLKSPVDTQEILGPGRGNLGVIAAFTAGCHCQGANCSTYVYLKTAGSYKLAFTGSFASLHPMKGLRNGYPPLTAKLQVSDSRVETTVYDWNGKKYQPSLCATVTQGPNQKRPSIARHACSGESRPR